jgi:hypothetical protein
MRSPRCGPTAPGRPPTTASSTRSSAARRAGTAPAQLVAAAAEQTRALPPALRKQVSLEAEGDPLNLGQRTHPPTALRIAALGRLPAAPERDGRSAAVALSAAELDARLTRRWLAPLGLRRWDGAPEALLHPEPPAPGPAALQSAQRARPQVVSGLELDFEREGSAPAPGQSVLHRDEVEFELEPPADAKRRARG